MPRSLESSPSVPRLVRKVIACVARRLTAVSILTWALFCTPPLAALQPDDLYDLRQVAIEDLSTDGRHLLCTIRTYDRELERDRAELRLYDLDTGAATVILDGEDYRAARWRPDGRAIAVVLTGDDGARLWLMAPDGSDRRRISDLSYGYGDLAWSPDGSHVAFIDDAPVGEHAGVSSEMIVAEDIGYRHLNVGYREGKLAQLYVLDIDSGAARRVVDAPLDVRAFAWSPDGSRLVFEAKRKDDLGLNLNSDLWVVDRDGGQTSQLTVNSGPDTNPLWPAPDRIAYLRHENPLDESEVRLIATIDDLEQGDRDCPPPTGGEFDNFIWRLLDGGRYFTGFVAGCIDLFEVAPGYPAVTPGGFDFWDVRIVGDRAVLNGASQTCPGAIYVLDLEAARAGSQHRSGRDLEPLVDPNREWYERAVLTEPQAFSIDVEGHRVHGWYYLPDDSSGSPPWPTVLSIHGGPEWMYGGYFLQEFHALPARGYAVIIANPTGSTGYGMAFQKAIRGDWVGLPARDLMACLDWAVAQGWADRDRLAVMGGSYGGHLAAALTTQTERFRAAAVDRMTCDLVSMWGTTDEKWFPEWQFRGRPWQAQAAEVYRRNSPINFVDAVTTPTLISHGMRDYRCLIGQAEQWFSALKVQGVPTRFLRFQNEGHGIRGRANQVAYLEELLAWFDRYVRSDGP